MYINLVVITCFHSTFSFWRLHAFLLVSFTVQCSFFNFQVVYQAGWQHWLHLATYFHIYFLLTRVFVVFIRLSGGRRSSVSHPLYTFFLSMRVYVNSSEHSTVCRHTFCRLANLHDLFSPIYYALLPPFGTWVSIPRRVCV